MKDTLIFAVDFDGTCTTHSYPFIGKDIGAVPVLKELVKLGHRLIIWTMRDGRHLQESVDWYASHGIEVFGVNRNPEQNWTESPKAYAQIYIDDAALPLSLMYHDPEFHPRPFVNWNAVVGDLHSRGIFDDETADRLIDKIDFSSKPALLQGVKFEKIPIIPIEEL
jgi:hypothetical protein